MGYFGAQCVLDLLRAAGSPSTEGCYLHPQFEWRIEGSEFTVAGLYLSKAKADFWIGVITMAEGDRGASIFL